MSIIQRLSRSRGSTGPGHRRILCRRELLARASGAALFLAAGLVDARSPAVERGIGAVVTGDSTMASASGERPREIDTDAVRLALERAAALVRKCKPHAGVSGEGRVRVRYERSGHVESVQVLTPKFQNGPTGACVRMLFLRANIEPFQGRSQEFEHPFFVPG